MNLLSSIFKGNDDQGLLPTGTNLSIHNRNVKIIQKIGEGGFATVYAAKDSKQKYAVKHCKCMSAEQIQLIDHEIEIMEKCATSNHPNIVHYYGCSKKTFAAQEMSSRRVEYFILLEFMDATLISYIQKHQQANTIIPERQLLELFLDIVSACFLLHSQYPPIAHRDIKIDNVLIKYGHNSDKIRLKLCDFGSCVDGNPKICQSTREINIESELIDRFTTPSYRSPEMIDLYQRKELSTKVDVWALGCVLFLMAYFEHPFPEGSKMSILDAKYKIPIQMKDQYSKKVYKLMKLCFHKDPVKRPTTKQLAEHLSDIIAGGKGTLSGKSKKRSNSMKPTKTNELLLQPKSQNMDPRRKSGPITLPSTKEESKTDLNNDDGWDPFATAEDDPPNDVFDDDFENVFNNVKQLKLSNSKSNVVKSNDDAFISDAFENDFFGNGGKNKKKGKAKKRKSGGKPQPVDARQSTRKKKKHKPQRSRSKSPKRNTNKNKKSAPRPRTPQPQPMKHPKVKGKNVLAAQQRDPRVAYGDQLAQLISMGFTDETKNINAIMRAKGNIQVAVSILIAQ
eukprot:97699_1